MHMHMDIHSYTDIIASSARAVYSNSCKKKNL